MSEILPVGEDTPGGPRGGRTRRMAEVAAVVSAATALAALVFGLFGLTGSGFGSGGSSRTPAAPGAPGGSPEPPAERPSASPTATAVPPPASAPEGTATTRPTPTPVDTPPAPPAGWHRVDASALTASLALPDGWKIKDDDAMHVNWVSPDGRYVIGVKRDGTHGSTAQAASIGQLAWYRKAAESKMVDLTARSSTLEQGGRSAVRLDLDFRWEGVSSPARRIELFVAGEQGQVYQLLAEDQHLDGTSALIGLFETARTHLRTDRH
ncbi:MULTISPECIES: hypothetical protein [unclassified Streptomyces]|uniref:hypothetical protein n=1 Tax=unclassified Streptomyces TaxID=2593676 RepID=UPI0009C264BE|nr:hypothetical protein [Streptomyces sp. Sge12]ARE73940.1 hypothetical protein B6R96_08325 [Streptomyces sp. Sge12]